MTQYFAEDATYAPGDGTEITGRHAIFNHLKQSVDSLDRRFDSRALSVAEPEVRDDQVSVSWHITFKLAGVPDLVMSGQEVATFDGDAIAHLEDTFDADAAEAMQGWMAEHGSALA